MVFLGLPIAELLALFGAVASVVVALYFLDRSRRKVVVPVLRFWQSAAQPPEMQRRRRIQQPLSLLLQLLALLCLIAAIGQPRFDIGGRGGRDHVVLLDGSAWMGSAAASGGTLLDEARRTAWQYINHLSRADRVLLVRADALATPLTGFEDDRSVLEAALRRVEPASTALQLSQALALAEQVQRRSGRPAGEIVYIGAGRLPNGGTPDRLPRNLRVMRIGGSMENLGLRKAALRRTADGLGWDLYVAARNDSNSPRSTEVLVTFGGALVGRRALQLGPQQEQSFVLPLRTDARGAVEIKLNVVDALAADNVVRFEVPERKVVRVTICSDQPDALRPLFPDVPGVRPAYLTAAQCAADRDTDLWVFHRMPVRRKLTRPAIYLHPEGDATLLRTAHDAPIEKWRTDHPLARGLYGQQLNLPDFGILATGPGDRIIAEAGGGPVLVAHDAEPKAVLTGWDPSEPELRYQLVTPLLFANMVNWLAPEAFRTWEAQAESVGSTSLSLDQDATKQPVEVTDADGRPLPYSLQQGRLNLFSPRPAVIRVRQGTRERSVALTLPELATAEWSVPATISSGLPAPIIDLPTGPELWPWLAGLGLALLAADWVLFGRMARPKMAWTNLLRRTREPLRRAS